MNKQQALCCLMFYLKKSFDYGSEKRCAQLTQTLKLNKLIIVASNILCTMKKNFDTNHVLRLKRPSLRILQSFNAIINKQILRL